MHDTDGNNKLDGCELVKSLIHWHGREDIYFLLVFWNTVLLIWDVYPGSEFFHPGSRVKKVPDPGSRIRIHIKEAFLTQKIVSMLSEL
jgi:hypothetical protein